MTIKINENNLKKGVLGLVVSLVEIIQEVLERQSLRRMESGRLTEEEINRLGEALADLEQAIKDIKKHNGIEDVVKSVRQGLDVTVEDVINKMINPEKWAETEEKGVAR